MKNSINLFTVFILLGFFLGACNPKIDQQHKESTKEGLTENIVQLLETQIPIWQAELNIPNVGIGLIEDGKILQTKVYGELPKGIPAPNNALFNIASITKVLVATLTLKLVAAGKWNLDEPLYPYFIDPDVADDPRHQQLTTRHILSQQSGFVNWRWNHPSEKLTFDFDPGTTYNYSGEGMEYLRKALENKFKMSLSEIADTHLFTPLAMKDTWHQWNGKDHFNRFCQWHNTAGENYEIEDYSTEDNAADDIITSVEDMAKFGVHVINGAGLSDDLFQEMVGTQSVINQNLQQGLGWRVVNNLSKNEYAIQHGGNDIGVATLIVLLPKSKCGIVVFTNGDNGLLMCNNIVRMALSEGAIIIHKSYKNTDISEAPEAIILSEALLQSYEGVYIQPSGRQVAISKKENNLILKMPGTPLLNFLPLAQDTFFLMDFDALLSFSKDDNGTIDAALIIEGDNIIRCEKEK